MQSHVYLPQFTIDQVIYQIFATGQISRREEQRLMSALIFKVLISLKQKNLVNKLFNTIHFIVVR
ncbi:MAG: hypothetical protein AB1861_25095 [Cyanobacteriota bacterium]